MKIDAVQYIFDLNNLGSYDINLDANMVRAYKTTNLSEGSSLQFGIGTDGTIYLKKGYPQRMFH